MIGFLKNLLLHPEAKNLCLDDPQTTILRKNIIRKNGFLEKLYIEWYESILDSLPDTQGPVVELGSGAGFMEEKIPGLIMSDMLPVPGLSLTLDAHRLPFADHKLGALVMIDVLHHLPKPRLFFGEASRCLQKGGVLTMIEPWYSMWSAAVYRHLHHEPFNTETANWEFPESGPLSGANGAMPWLIFKRDRTGFEAEFPQLIIKSIQLLAPFRYLVSGGSIVQTTGPGMEF